MRRAAVTALVLCAPLAAQGIVPRQQGGQYPGGTWVNFETPQCKPLATIALGRPEDPEHYLLACNTEDNRLEVFRLRRGSMPQPVDRARVGLHPVSVVPVVLEQDGLRHGIAYTANMLGDSVSAVVLQWTPTGVIVSEGPTRNVGDEPMDLVYDPQGNNLFVTLNSRNAMTAISAATLETAPGLGDPHFALLDQVSFRPGPGLALQTTTAAINQPRTIALAPTGADGQALYVLGARGTHHDYPGLPQQNTFHETELGFDLYRMDLSGSAPTPVGSWRRLGTKNFNMGFDRGGACFVVSGDAANRAAKGKANVSGEPTGFLRTLLHVIERPWDPTSPMHTKDLNTLPGSQAPVAPASSLSHCVDVAVFEKGDIYKVFVAAFHSSRLGIISNVKTGAAFNPAGSWGRAVTDLAKPGPARPTFPGLSGLALTVGDPTRSNDPGDRVYVLGRFDATIDVVDAIGNGLLGTVSLQNDPTPQYVRDGRRFLYEARQPTGNGFNACASCHFAGRMDGLRWDLSDGPSNAPFRLEMIATLEDPSWATQTTFGFTDPKGEFITQSLQGLVTSEVADPLAQDEWFTAAPYHWDMDMATVADFNVGGFQNLLGGAGLDDADLDAFVRLVNSIHYPPNKEQPITRTFSGSFGNPNDNTTGSGGQLGLKVFHTFPIPGDPCLGRSCVQCHALPEGGNNLGTIRPAPSLVLSGGPVPLPVMPMKSTPMRGMDQKEVLLLWYAIGSPQKNFQADFAPPYYPQLRVFGADVHFDLPTVTVGGTTLYTPSNGLSHPGFVETINDFVAGFPGLDPAVTMFAREFDSGTAPVIGQAVTLPSNDPNDPAKLQTMMQQVRFANAGLAVAGTLGGGRRGFWYLPGTTSGAVGLFFDVQGGAGMSLTTLLGLMQVGDQLVFQSTPLGMERRIAGVASAPVVLTGPAPSNAVLESMVPQTAFVDVPSLLANWDPAGTAPFTWLGNTTLANEQEPWDLKSVRWLQAGAGIASSHQPPRRFRVAATDLRAGAFLRLSVPMLQGPPIVYRTIELPLYPSGEVSAATGARIWETAVEADAQIAGVFAVGGWWAKGVEAAQPGQASVLRRDYLQTAPAVPPAGFFDPTTWNRYGVQVVNEDGQASAVSVQSITVEPAGWTRG